MLSKRLFVYFLVGFFFFLFSSKVKAKFSFEIESINPVSVSSKEEIVEVKLKITDLPSESYFRVAWQRLDGGSYFGYVKNNNDEWVEVKPLSDDCSSYYKISDASATAAILFTKIGEETDIGAGTYKIKGHRFTTTASCSYTASNNEVEITVNIPSPTPIPTDTPIPTETPIPSKTPMPVQNPTVTTLVVVNSPTAKPTPKNTVSPVITVWENQSSFNSDGEVLGINETPIPSLSIEKSNNFINGAKIALVLGLLFCGMAILLFAQRYNEIKKE